MNLIPQSGQVSSASSPTSSPTWATIRLWTTASRARLGGDSGSDQARLPGAGRAEVELPPLAVDPLGQVDRGLVLAPLADHERADLWEGIEETRSAGAGRGPHRP